MINETAKQIAERFNQMGHTVPVSEIESRLDKLLNEFKVPAEEARRSVVNFFLKEHNIPRGDFYTQQGETTTVTVKDINAEGKWINLRVKVVQLWDNNHESVAQEGLMSDETGSVEFTKWANAGLPELKEGRSYQLKNVVTTSFQGRFGIDLNRSSQIEEINEDIDTSKNQVISDINTEGKRISIRAKVIQLWDNNHESIGQVGLVGDETGTIKFTKWTRASLPDLEEGKSYLLKNVVTDSYQGRFGINLDHCSQIEEINEDIEISIKQVISDIDADGKWVDIRAKVVQLWDSTHESIGQVGLLGDETGTIKFTKWANAQLPPIEEGKSYLFKSAVTSTFQDRFQINLNRASQIEAIDEDIEIGNASIEFTGAMVDIQSGSGLIRRCPQCNRALIKGVCGEHGKVEGTHDLRIKAVIDDGVTVQDALLNREVSENLTGITLEDALRMATEALEQEVVVDRIRRDLVGRYYTLTGPRLDRYILVESISPLPPLDAGQIDALIAKSEHNVPLEV